MFIKDIIKFMYRENKKEINLLRLSTFKNNLEKIIWEISRKYANFITKDGYFLYTSTNDPFFVVDKSYIIVFNVMTENGLILLAEDESEIIEEEIRYE